MSDAGEASGRDYRDELAAAHARIAALEERLASEGKGSADAVDRKVAELEEQLRRTRLSADPARARRVGIIVGVAFLLVGLVPVITLVARFGSFVLSDAAPILVFFALVATALGFFVGKLLPSARRSEIARLEQMRDEALHMKELEAEVKETRRALAEVLATEGARPRVAVPSEDAAPAEQAEPDGDEAAAKRVLR
jgi:hypothetical protein